MHFNYFKHAGLAVVPMWIARSIQNKTLEAIAIAKPAVVMPKALEGIDLPKGPTLYLAEDAQDFAKPCINALTEGQAAFRGTHARQWAQDQFS